MQKSKNKCELSEEMSVRTVKQSVTELEIGLEAFDPSQCRLFTLLFKTGTKINFGT